MNKIEQTYIDKTSWPNGEWKEEPDRISWVDPETGYHCLIKRGPVGALCGYVAIEKTHPYYKKDHNDIDWEFEVHGGLTYSKHCNGNAEVGICHLTKDNDDAWWFGFDCAHYGDFCPRYESVYNIYTGYDIYRDVEYVKFQVTSLAKQLKENGDKK